MNKSKRVFPYNFFMEYTYQFLDGVGGERNLPVLGVLRNSVVFPGNQSVFKLIFDQLKRALRS